jgi:phosphoglycerate dehydrogenase-like enzyme
VGRGSPVVPIVTAPAETAPPGIDAIRERAAEVRLAADRASLEAALPGTDVLLVTDFRSAILREAWHAADGVAWVHAASAGVDVIAFPELAHDAGVVVTNARGVFDRPIAEWVLGVALLFTKDLHTTLRLQSERRWEHRESGVLAGTRAVVVGVGGIGRAIARLLSAVGVSVAAVARGARDGDPDLGTIHAVDDLPEVLPGADWVVLAVPLTAETRRLIGARELSRMDATARLINVGRGELVDEDALIEALRARSIAGAALDVFHTEPLPDDHPLWEMEEVVISPHMSGDFVGWRDTLAEQFVDNLDRWLADEPLDNVVDLRRYLTTGGGT